jgi:hypothetical protein
VLRVETGPGAQAQMDDSPYDLDFSDEGRRRVHAFRQVLRYSRRPYRHFVEAQDFDTTLREHVRAFAYLGGVAATCLYDNMKVVVTRSEDDVPLYNQRFLAFATHVGFRPIACKPDRPQPKGQVERPFQDVQTNLLNGRTFRTLAHLHAIAAWWRTDVADVRLHAQTKKTPRERYDQERPHLIPLPAQAHDVYPVRYRVVNRFDCLERRDARDAASRLFKLIDAGNQKRATALVPPIDFDAWGEYLGDPPLASAWLDRLVDGARIVKINGKSYRAHRAPPAPTKKQPP